MMMDKNIAAKISGFHRHFGYFIYKQGLSKF